MKTNTLFLMCFLISASSMGGPNEPSIQQLACSQEGRAITDKTHRAICKRYNLPENPARDLVIASPESLCFYAGDEDTSQDFSDETLNASQAQEAAKAYVNPQVREQVRQRLQVASDVDMEQSLQSILHPHGKIKQPLIVHNLLPYTLGCCQCSQEDCCQVARFMNPLQLRYCRPTVKRVAGLTAGAAMGAAMGILYWQFGLNAFSALVDSLAAFVLINGAEPILSTMALFHKMPGRIQGLETPMAMRRKMAIIIPVHGAGKNVEPTIRSFLQAGYIPEQLFVMENTGGRYTKEVSSTFRLLQSPQYNTVNYYFISAFGNKVASVTVGAILAQEKGFTHMLSVDDDVQVSSGFDPLLSLLNEKVTLIAYPIEPTTTVNWLEWMQKLEYANSDMHNAFKAEALKTTHAPHGAASASTIENYLKAMRGNKMRFLAEDQELGRRIRAQGGHIALTRDMVKTDVPPNCCVWWSQRAGSWNVGEITQVPKVAFEAVTTCPESCKLDELTRTAIKEFYLLQSLWSVFSSAIRPCVLASMAPQPLFWIVSGALWEINNLITTANKTVCVPRRNNERMCAPRNVVNTCIATHTSCFYNGMQMLAGSAGLCCACCGAGASREEDFSAIRRGPKALRRALKVESAPLRQLLLLQYAKGIANDPRGAIQNVRAVS